MTISQDSALDSASVQENILIENAATALGKNALSFKIRAFIIACGLASIAGVLYAGYITYIDPSSFNLNESIFILTAVVIGGAGSTYGPLLGGCIVIFLPESLRFMNLPDQVAASSREIIFALLLILLMRLRPQGLVGEYGFGKK